MTVARVCLAQKPGDASFDKADELYATYFVFCDDVEDGPNTVHAITGNASPGPDRIPIRGELYEWGNEVGTASHSTKRIRRIRSKSAGNYPAIYEVICKFERSSDEPDGSKPDGTQASNPSEVQAVVEPGYRFVQRPYENAVFRGFFDANGNEVQVNAGANDTQMQIGEKYPIQNSSWQAFLPPPERTVGIPTVTAKKYYRSWSNSWDDSIQTTNNAPYRIQFRDGSGISVYDRTFQQNTLLLNSVTPQQRQFGDEIWYWLAVEFWINPDGWHRNYVDRGTRQVVEVTASGAIWEPISDARGNRPDRAVLLDGKGHELATQDPKNAIYLRYDDAPQTDFSTLGFMYE